MNKPDIAGTSPQMEELEIDKNYAWCSCGKSSKQPWCDGHHKGTGFTPQVFSVNKTKIGAMCMCKQSKNPPYCDGSHRNI